jgi:hypothetical protein
MLQMNTYSLQIILTLEQLCNMASHFSADFLGMRGKVATEECISPSFQDYPSLRNFPIEALGNERMGRNGDSTYT